MTIPKDLLEKIAHCESSEELESILEKIKNRSPIRTRGKYYGKKTEARYKLNRAKFVFEWAEMKTTGNYDRSYADLVAVICEGHASAVDALKSLLILISGHLRKYDEIVHDYVLEFHVEPSEKKSIRDLIDKVQSLDRDIYFTLRDRVWAEAEFLDKIYLPIKKRTKRGEGNWSGQPWLSKIAKELFGEESPDKEIYDQVTARCIQKARHILETVQSLFV